jgi:protein-S-isoprenylcysteine O-methyltransferase Ste14
MAKIGLDALFYLSRRFPKETCFSLYAWTSEAGGTFLHLLFTPVPSQQYAAAQGMQIVGLVLQIAAILSLNRSFGVVPANRGIKTNGLYSVVRHPIYTSYVIGLTGLLINQFSALNLMVFTAWVVFQLLRIHYEEDFLMADPAYQAFSQRTKWRLIPFVF